MKQIYLFMICVMASLTINAQNDINFDASSMAGTTAPPGWRGFMNVFDNPKDGSIGGYQFGSAWGVADLIAIVDGGTNTVTLKPNRIGDTAPYWQSSGVLEGNKIMDATFYIEDDALAGTSFTFNANIMGNTLDGSSLSIDYTYKAFIKVFASDYSSVLNEVNNSVLGGGDFTLVMDATSYVSGEHVQYGFEVIGPNINSDASFDAAYDNLGSIVVGPNTTLSFGDSTLANFNVYPNPARDNWNIKASNEISKIQLFDMLGKQVLSINPKAMDVQIDASVLPSGLYFAKVSSISGTQNLKLIRR